MRIAICGAGIGGLTLAAALREHEVFVVERRPKATGIGAGLLLHDEALAALGSAGVEISGKRFTEFRLGLADGRLLPATARLGHAITRPALHRALLAACDSVDVRTDTTVQRFEESDAGVHVWLSDGEELDVDVLVGADGLSSSVREQLGGGANRRYSGATCWRGLTSVESGHENPIEVWGDGRRVGIVPLLEGTYLYLTQSTPAGTPRTPAPADQFSHFGFGADALIRSVPQDAWAHHDLDELEQHVWGTSRVHLLGDAAHGFTPNMGEGAAQAILDAVYLAGCLGGRGIYPGPRQSKNARIARMSRWLGRVGEAKGGWATLRGGVLRVVARRPA